jgi:hypothetical protein
MMPLRAHGSESLAFPAPSFALAVAGRAFEDFPCSRWRPRAPSRFRSVPPPSLVASAACSRPVDVATDRPPEPSASSASPSSPRPSPLPRDPAQARFPVALTIRRPRRVSSSRFPSAGSPLDPSTPGPAPKRWTFGPLVPPRGSRSARVVSHHLDGFLRTDGASTVAARSRPWGSPCFSDTLPCTVLLSREPPGQRDRARSHGALTPRRCSPPAVPPPLTAPPEGAAFTRRCSLLAVSRGGTAAARRPGASRFTVAFSPPRVRLRGLVLPAGLSPSFAVASDRQLYPSMGFCSPFSHRGPPDADGAMANRLAARSSRPSRESRQRTAPKCFSAR